MPSTKLQMILFQRLLNIFNRNEPRSNNSDLNSWKQKKSDPVETRKALDNGERYLNANQKSYSHTVSNDAKSRLSHCVEDAAPEIKENFVDSFFFDMHSQAAAFKTDARNDGIGVRSTLTRLIRNLFQKRAQPKRKRLFPSDLSPEVMKDIGLGEMAPRPGSLEEKWRLEMELQTK